MSTLERSYFEDLKKIAFEFLRTQEHLFFSLDAESSQFIRFNHARIRQTGKVEDAQISLTFLFENSPGELRRASRSFTLSGNLDRDRQNLLWHLKILRDETPRLPVDPYAEAPKSYTSSQSEKVGSLLSPDETYDAILRPASNADFVGLYACGPIARAFANSTGLTHWLRTESFLIDYSLYTPSQRAVKGLMGGSEWNSAAYKSRLQEDRDQLELLGLEPRKLTPDEYRVYLAPRAVADLIAMFSWGCVGEASIRQGDSPLWKLRGNSASFSPQFNLSEDFRGGEVPRWNEEGALAPDEIRIISEGRLCDTLVSTRTSREYALPSNAATSGEGLRSPVMKSGDLCDPLAELESGIYISNLHYLNWSDQFEGRITGMTRFACFWVEGGKLIRPIENMRFDDTIFRIFGPQLLKISKSAEWIPETSTYGMRMLGSSRVPGILLSGLRFTL